MKSLQKAVIYTIRYRIIWSMRNIKVTALIPNDLIDDVKDLADGQNLTECLIVALSEWTAIQKIRKLNTQLKKKPLEFQKGFTARGIREVNRRRRN